MCLEVLLASLTLEVSVVGVLTKMLLVVLVTSEAFLTKRTGVRIDAQMVVDVSLQSILGPDLFVADVA